MKIFNRIRLPSENSDDRSFSQSFSVLNPSFAPYESLDLSSSSHEQIENSVQTINPDTEPTILPSAHCNTTDDSKKKKKQNFGTFRGVFCPVTLHMFSLSIFIRIPFILAHAGLLQTLLQYGIAFLIILPTSLSICALATNGAIQAGGIYHMISRALGPEFGGSIGVLFFFATLISNGQGVAALVEALVELFGSGIINLFSLTLCLFGSSLFSLATIFIFTPVFFIYLTVIISFCVEHPKSVLIPVWNTLFYQQQTVLSNQTELFYGQYTGFSSTTFKENIYSNYTYDYTTGDKTRFESIFGVLFSSITGILAGASMSTDLKKPNRSIPNGSIGAIIFAFLVFIIETFFIAATTSRDILLNYNLFLSDVNMWQPFVIVGIIAAVFSACLSTMTGASRILYALSVDEIFGILLRWIRSGTTRHGNPIAAFLFTFTLVELILLIGSVNAIAPIVTIFYLLAYFAVNVSCLALDLASAPNFRPTFKYFSWHTALLGTVGSIIMSFIVSPIYASVSIGVLIGLVAILHLRDFPRESWGSISQALIFHQVRKYLLLLDPRKEHVKFWRPKMLLLVANPRSSIDLIDFVNDMKKGGLFILGHVKKRPKQLSCTDPCTQEHPYWVSLVNQMKIKAFLDITLASNIRDGIIQLIRISGLGKRCLEETKLETHRGLRPNTIILGFYDDTIPEDRLRQRPFYKNVCLNGRSLSISQDNITASQTHAIQLRSLHDEQINDNLSFPSLRQADQVKLLDVESYVHIINEGLHLKKSICLARNFHLLQKDSIGSSKHKVFIDIWPVNIIFPKTSNQFDVTCLYMLQLATILCMVKPWKTRVILRVFVCLDAVHDDAIRTQEHFADLLRQLRIRAKIRIISWENVTALLTYSSMSTQLTDGNVDSPAASMLRTSFVDVNDEYIRGVNELIHQQCDNTSCLYLYLPRPPQDQALFSRYIQVLDMLTVNLPATLFVHGVSPVTCTNL